MVLGSKGSYIMKESIEFSIGRLYQQNLSENDHGKLRGPPQCHPPPKNKALIRLYWGKPMVNSSPLIRPYLLAEVAFGGPLWFPWNDGVQNNIFSFEHFSASMLICQPFHIEAYHSQIWMQISPRPNHHMSVHGLFMVVPKKLNMRRVEGTFTGKSSIK